MGAVLVIERWGSVCWMQRCQFKTTECWLLLFFQVLFAGRGWALCYVYVFVDDSRELRFGASPRMVMATDDAAIG